MRREEELRPRYAIFRPLGFRCRYAARAFNQ